MYDGACLYNRGDCFIGCCLLLLRLQATERQASGNSEPDRIDTECCGQHLICEKESLLAGASREIVYYDDEELDRYAGRPSDGYAIDEIGEFEDVFYTLAPGEVAGWIRSLQLRDISLPDALKAEVVLVIEEQRRQSARN